MTTQQAYERIREYFSHPRAVIAWDSDMDQCAYRVGKSAKGARCAIGCLIPDSLYRKKFDDGDTPPEAVISAIPSLEGVALGFLLDAQTAHDAAAGRDNAVQALIESLDDVARAHGLKVAA